MATMSDEDIPMAQCGACNSIIPLDSESCPVCNVRFGGTSEQELGECGACEAIIPADSTSCPSCGAVFVETQVESDTQPDDSSDTIQDEIVVDATPKPSVISAETEEMQESDTNTEMGDSQSTETDQIQEVADETDDVELVHEDDTDGDSDSEEDQVTEEDTDDVTIDPIEEDILEDISDSEDSETVIDANTESEEDSGEDTIETMMDDLVDDLDSEQPDEDLDEEVVEEKEPEAVIEDSEIVMAFENLALAIAAKGMTAAEAFGEMDSSDDNLLDAPELQKGIENIAGEKLIPKHVTAILNYLDTDGDRRIDPNELVKALEDLRIGIQPGKLPKVKTFPSPLQKFLMGKKANDILYPIAYFLMVTFIGIWVVNGMGLIVDGTGGTVVYEGGTDQWGGEISQANWNLCESDALDDMIDPCQGTVSVGEPYPCDPTLDANKCQNSLTPFSGTDGASSMPAGFYGDGIFMMILGVIGLAAIAYLHLLYAPSLRERVKKGTSKEDDNESTDEVEESDEQEVIEEDDEYEEENALEAPVDLEIAEDSEDEEDEDEDYDDDIDVGDYIGIEVDGEEFFGEIIEFDDDEGTVTIETEDGEEVTGEQDDMFLDDE